MNDKLPELKLRPVYRVRPGFGGKSVLQKQIDSPSFLGGRVDASVRQLSWVDVPYDQAPAGLRIDERAERTDAEILEAVERRVGMGCRAWDCINPLGIAAAFRAELLP